MFFLFFFLSFCSDVRPSAEADPNAVPSIYSFSAPIPSRLKIDAAILSIFSFGKTRGGFTPTPFDSWQNENVS